MGVVKVAKVKDCLAGSAIAVDVNTKRVAIFNVDGQYYAIDDECTHAGGSLSEGTVADHVVTCPWHGATFDITNGKVLSAPAYDKVNSYPVKVDGEDLKIEV